MRTLNQFKQEIEDLLVERSGSREFNRLEWLCDHLWQYLERWLGFAKIERTSNEAAVQTQLFICVLAAIDLIDKELESLPNVQRRAGAQWLKFKNTIEWIKHTPNRDDLVLIENSFVSFGKVALSKTFVIEVGQAVPIKDWKTNSSR